VRTNMSSARDRKRRVASQLVRITLAASVALLAAGRANAQYGGGGTGGTGGGAGGTYTPPSRGYGGSGKAIGIGVGAAAGAGLLYLALHKSSVTGCVQPAEDGLRFADEKEKYVVHLGVRGRSSQGWATRTIARQQDKECVRGADIYGQEAGEGLGAV